MSWNYRVLKFLYPTMADIDDRAMYEVHEVYYGENNDDHPNGWTAREITPHGPTREEFTSDFRRWLVAITKPVLVVDEDKFVGTEPPIAADIGALAGLMRGVYEKFEPLPDAAAKALDALTTDQQKSWPDSMGVLVNLGALRAIRTLLRFDGATIDPRDIYTLTAFAMACGDDDAENAAIRVRLALDGGVRNLIATSTPLPPESA